MKNNIKSYITLRSLCLISAFVFCSFASARTYYPDSVQQASDAELRIKQGFNMEIYGGIGMGRYEFTGAFSGFKPTHVENTLGMPTWQAGIDFNWYFVPWMGIGTGLSLTSYTNTSLINSPWQLTGIDYQGQQYDLTSMPVNLAERQRTYMFEVPFALKFRYIPRRVGLLATAGVRVGLPFGQRYKLLSNGYFDNSVYYEHWDLTMGDIPNVLENWQVQAKDGQSAGLQVPNIAGMLEFGALFNVNRNFEISLSLFADYYFNNIMYKQSTSPLGFSDAVLYGEYPDPFAYNGKSVFYDGVLETNEVQELHPWTLGLKLGLHINAGMTDAQRQYKREQRIARRAEREAQREAEREARREAMRAAQEAASTVWIPTYTVDTFVPTTPDTVVEYVYVEPTPKELAMQQIQQIAEEYGIPLCTDSVVHDTIYITVKDTVSAAQQLDDVLHDAVIYFNLDDTVPILEPSDVLIRIADVLKSHPNQRIHINGHACKLGKPAYNKRLALRRAKAVALQLEQLGVKREQMEIKSLGSEEPYRYNYEHQLSKDRRVEIIPITSEE